MQPSDNYDKAYVLATQGIECSESAKEKVRPVLLSVINEGALQAGKLLEPVWPEKFSWPAADQYLQEKGKPLKPSNYAEALRLLTSRIVHRLHRIDQIHDLYQSEISRRRRGHVFVGSFYPERPTECGIEGYQVMTAEQFINKGIQPCTLIGCQCEIGTLSNKEMEKNKEYVSSYIN